MICHKDVLCSFSKGNPLAFDKRNKFKISLLAGIAVFLIVFLGYFLIISKILQEQTINTEESTPPLAPVIESQKVKPQNLEHQSSKAKVSIYFSRWKKRVQGNKQDFLLDQGEAAGLILPYSCRAGSCGSCKAKLISGQVQQNSTDGLSASEQQQGYILLCSCNALTDVEVSHE